MRKDTIKSEKQDSIQSASAQVSTRSRTRLTLLKSLIILAIIYAAGEILSQYITLALPNILLWTELGMWVIILTWLLVGVRPPFMEWLKKERERNG